MERLNLQDLIDATGGQLSAAPPDNVTFGRVCIDSREVRPGDLFWAMPGERNHGHDFIPQARERGAALCVTTHSRRETATDRASWWMIRSLHWGGCRTGIVRHLKRSLSV